MPPQALGGLPVKRVSNLLGPTLGIEFIGDDRVLVVFSGPEMNAKNYTVYDTATGEELTEYCRGKIATFKIPRHWKVVDSFPMTVTGKIQKFRMREMAVEELGLQVAAGVQTA